MTGSVEVLACHDIAIYEGFMEAHPKANKNFHQIDSNFIWLFNIQWDLFNMTYKTTF